MATYKSMGPSDHTKVSLTDIAVIIQNKTCFSLQTLQTADITMSQMTQLVNPLPTIIFEEIFENVDYVI